MATCRNCIHCDVCCREHRIRFPDEELAKATCRHFKDKFRLAPCEVGTTVYLIDKELLKADPQNCQIYEDTVYEVGRGKTSDGSIKWLCLVEDTGLDFYDTDIGETAFFDYEAAERRLMKEAVTW